MDDPTVNGDSSIIDLPRSGETVLGSEKPTVWLAPLLRSRGEQIILIH